MVACSREVALLVRIPCGECCVRSWVKAQWMILSFVQSAAGVSGRR